MTSRNSPWNNDTSFRGNKPFLLKPAGKDYLWGGNRLNDDFGKGIALSPLAETWECSVHPEGQSIVANGREEGMTLAQVLSMYPEYMGTHPKAGEFPVLIKFIDAKQNLSVQVHPDDDYAKKHENGQRGKTELWYVLDAAMGAGIVYGLNRDVDRETMRQSIEEGTVERLLRHVPVARDDVFFIEAGTIHAIGKGVLIAEIQESSDLTYRLYDYDRTDKNGKRRELHVEKALQVADLRRSREPRQPFRVLRYQKGCAMELLCRCQYFEIHRMIVNTARCRQMVEYQADSMSFRVLLCVEGCGSIFFGEEAFCFFQGDCIFVPADSVKMKMQGRAVFLDIRG